MRHDVDPAMGDVESVHELVSKNAMMHHQRIRPGVKATEQATLELATKPKLMRHHVMDTHHQRVWQ
jgi:hypothetical protein